jgi:hypothetical protein
MHFSTALPRGHSRPVRALDRILGVDRAPEVKPIRRKLAELAAGNPAVSRARPGAGARLPSRTASITLTAMAMSRANRTATSIPGRLCSYRSAAVTAPPA